MKTLGIYRRLEHGIPMEVMKLTEKHIEVRIAQFRAWRELAARLPRVFRIVRGTKRDGAVCFELEARYSSGWQTAESQAAAFIPASS